MSTDHDTLTRELALLMSAHNKWTARLEGLRRQAVALGDRSGEAVALLASIADLRQQLGSFAAELEASRAQAAEWEQKARALAQNLLKERVEKARRILALEQELARCKQGGPPPAT